MIECYRLYLPKSKREVKIEVSVPRNKENISFDVLYLFDGQNAFKDSHAAYGRSIRATKALGFAAKEMNKRILGVAIYNSGTDLGRVNEYSPFKIVNSASEEWEKQDVQKCILYCEDFINTIIPFIEKKYKTHQSNKHRFIYGSSLAAIAAIYLGVKYNDYFSYVGAFSPCPFLFEEEFYKFLDEHNFKKTEIFLYVGKNESSDDIYDKAIYYDGAIKLLDYLKKKKIRTRLCVDVNGQHNEETWGNHLLDFLNFIYYDDDFYLTNKY